jgi:hypothetical protein
MKNSLIKIVILLLILTGCSEQEYSYTVKYTTCDGKEVVTVANGYNGLEIINSKRAVPELIVRSGMHTQGYRVALNVCDFAIISSHPIK